MAYIVISITALFVSALTLFSGFELGTVLMPAFALFFPIQIVTAATAVVHLANNIFKIILVGRDADRGGGSSSCIDSCSGGYCRCLAAGLVILDASHHLSSNR